MTKRVRLVDLAPAARMHAVIAKGADGFGVAVLHAGEAIAFLTPAQAEEDGKRFLELARLARRPGSLPA